MKYNKIIFINPNYKIRFLQGRNVNEGGLPRNSAWEKLLGEKSNIEFLNLLLDKKSFFRLIKTFLLSKNKIIFSLYPSLGIQMYKKGLIKDLVRKIYFIIVKISSLYNEIVFDISDLKYEQAIDLQLEQFDKNILQQNEKVLFGIHRAYFIFSSDSMRSYAIRKYSLDKDKTTVCINGGINSENIIQNKDLKKRFCEDKNIIRFVYAGTLNKGRNIVAMIQSFPISKQKELILMGNDGQWLTKEIIQENITYLGVLSEEDAHYIVSKCDIGLIPYDDKLLYYNLAYPTKLSFYITAGIPFLSTPVNEVKNINEMEIGWSRYLKDWGDFFESISSEELIQKKENVEKIRHLFLWDNTLRNDFLGYTN